MVLFTSYLHLSLAFIGLRFVLFALLGFQNLKREDLLCDGRIGAWFSETLADGAY